MLVSYICIYTYSHITILQLSMIYFVIRASMEGKDRPLDKYTKIRNDFELYSE